MDSKEHCNAQYTVDPGMAVEVLESDRLRLEPLRVEHAGAYCEAMDESCFEYWMDRPEPFDVDGTRAMLEKHVLHPRTLHFMVFEKASNTPVASTSFLEVQPANRGIEIGWTWIREEFRRTWVNPEMKLLMLSHAFETDLFGPTAYSEGGCAMRVQLRTRGMNAQSRAAIEKLGAVFEGEFRDAMIMQDGRVASSVYYSILKAEWPEVKGKLLARLSVKA